ncbi:conserved hypothetical protein [Anaeromyxobacter dehalogenans 2CP-1]|uniref:Nitroreductase n=1 Tax=Anaeromyxobacter dehalogenans (strain ATCC BAA-258 / DSM 21875 / 2CP-1) TaxID=455488 RepID=B8JDT8_ANAD2|nr:hypothetical protein [Anaeromyxobacter dehalogenans]ACL64183.1 conserved hypothetical protein [Anaeromyxobacter dehalogenans 2CP-1]
MFVDAQALPAPDPRAFPSWGGPAERLRFLLAYAVLAPSRHNTQPWWFEVRGGEVGIHADGARALPEVDPDGRELVMACGAALANLRLAAAHFGHATSAEIIGTHRRDGLVARVRLEEQRALSPEDEELFQAIPRRRTNRLPLDGREPPEGLVTRLLREARGEGAWLRPVEAHQRRAVAELVAEGDRRQWTNPRFRAELAGWIHPSGNGRRDGMPAYAVGMSDAAARLQPLVARLSNPARAEAERDRRRALASKSLLVLSTAHDGLAEWMVAGIALQRILLRATAAGLTAAFFNQPIEQDALRGPLREAVGDPGMPQLLLRLGYGPEVRPTPRRSVDEVLRRLDAAARPAPLVLRRAPPMSPMVDPAAAAIAPGPPA